MDDINDLAWLVRDSSNRIRGPFRQNEIVQMIRKGQLKGKAEICHANAYWFAIEEKNELARFFAEFNGGRPAPEAPTQMTATLNQAAEAQDHGLEVTQFVATPGTHGPAGEPQEHEPAVSQPSGEKQVEWLNEEYAEDFGGDFGITISVQTDVSGMKPMSIQDSMESQAPKVEQNQITPISGQVPTSIALSGSEAAEELAPEESAREEMLSRATVKADTLPSEYKSFQGERPTPINSLIAKGGLTERQTGLTPSSGVVSVPVGPEPAGRIFSEEEEEEAQETARALRNRAILAVLGILVAGGAIWGAIQFKRSGGNLGTLATTLGKQAPVKTAPQRRAVGTGVDAVKRAILFFDLDAAKEVLSELEGEQDSKGQASFYLAQAIVKREFLYDPETAVLSLQTAKPLVKSRRTEAEVDNLIATYGFERDSQASIEQLRKLVSTYPDDTVFRYNLALSYLRTDKAGEAISLLEPMLARLGGDNPLLEDVGLALGWAIESYCPSNGKEAVCRKGMGAEEAYSKALESNSASAKARLGLALFRMRRGGIKAAEADFRAFLDEAPDLDPPTRITNFRKLQSNDFYDFAHSRIAELNTPGPNMTKASPLVMAVDAVIAALQTRTSEAAKILEPALAAAPGEANILKALSYVRWKENQYPGLIEVMRDQRGGFAVNVMLGKASLKLGKKDQAEKYFQALIDAFPGRSEGHSLMGDLFLSQNKIDEAKAQYMAALKLDSLDLLAWRGLDRTGMNVKFPAEIQKNLPF